MQRPALLFLAVLVFSVTPLVHAQAQCETQTFQSILSQVGDACADLGRNSVCYGNNAVSVAFWDDDAQTQFAAPGDLIPTDIVQRIETSRYVPDEELWGVALLRVQANIPNTLPGQAVTFLLMGDTEFANQVNPENATTPPDPVQANTLSPSNLRSAPTTNALIRGSVGTGTEMALIGRSSDEEWYEIETETGLPTWIFAELVEPHSAIDALPVTGGPGVPPRYGPMQAFYFTAGIGNPQCREAPEAMVVQSPDDYTVRLSINDLDITLGSTVVVFGAETTDGRSALVLVLVEGTLTAEIGGQPITASSDGSSPALVAVETDADGLVPLDASLIPVELLDTEDIMMRLAQLGDVLTGIDGLNIIFGDEITTDTAESLEFDVVGPPPPPVSNTPDDEDDSGNDDGTLVVPPPDSGGGGDSGGGDDDDDDDDVYGYGTILPEDAITVRNVDENARRRGNLMGVTMVLVVGMVGLFGVIEGRRPGRDD